MAAFKITKTIVAIQWPSTSGLKLREISHKSLHPKILKNHKMTSMRLVLGEINPKILLILSSLLVLIALYSFKGKAETVYYFYDVEKPTGTIQNQKYGFWLTAMNRKTTFMA